MPPKKKQGAPAEAKLEKLTVPKLRTELKKLGLDTNGLKVVLVARLKEALPPSWTSELLLLSVVAAGAEGPAHEHLPGGGLLGRGDE